MSLQIFLCLWRNYKAVCERITYLQHTKPFTMKLTFTLIALLSCCLLHAQKAGTLDSSFGINGKVLAYSDSGYLDCTGIGAQTDGSIIASGGTSFIGSSTNDFFALKYSADGKQDTSFGVSGIAVMTGLGLAQAIKVQPDNKIVIAGYNSDISERIM
jgi:uncharacterized delta-60 repeat protein